MATRLMNDNATAPAADPRALADRVTIRTIDDIHAAAVALCDVAAERGLRIAACYDIALKEPMVDAEGGIINADVFGWLADGERWWEDIGLALSSPLPRARAGTRANRSGATPTAFAPTGRNKYLDEMNLADFPKRALYHAAIVVPAHLPFGQIGAVSFPPMQRDQNDLTAEFAACGDLLGVLTRRFLAAMSRQSGRINRSQTVFKAGQLGYLGTAS